MRKLLICLGLLLLVGCGSVQSVLSGNIVNKDPATNTLYIGDCISKDSCAVTSLGVCQKVFDRFQLGQFFDVEAYLNGDYGCQGPTPYTRS